MSCLMDGLWSNEVPECVAPQTCSINPPIRGSISGNCATAQLYQKCYFRCDAGFVLSGAPALICLKSGWNLKPPICLPHSPLCPPLTAPVSGRIHEIASCSAGIPGRSICSFSCDLGLRLVGDSTLTCLPTGWSSAVPSCINLSCPSPPVIPGGSISCEMDIPLTSSKDETSPDQICHVKCSESFELKGEGTLKCLNNSFMVSQVPECIPSLCPVIPLPHQTFMRGTCSRRVGESCTIACFAGYTFWKRRGVHHNSYEMTCLGNRRWYPEHPPPACHRVTCESVFPSKKAKISISCLFPVVGDTCHFSCDINFRLSTPHSVIRCQEDGSWNLPIPSCVENVSEQDVEVCSSLKYSSDIPFGSSRCTTLSSIGSRRCYYSCRDGYKLLGNSILECNPLNQWSGDLPSCVLVSCPALIPPDNGEFTGGSCDSIFSSVCQVICDEGFILQGSGNYSCGADAKWTPDNNETTSQCVPVNCPLLISPMEGFMTGSCSNAIIGEICSFVCNDGFAIRGVSQLKCQLNHSDIHSAQWSDPLPECIRIQCPPLPLPKGSKGWLEGNCFPGVSGGMCRFKCPSTHRNEGKTNLLCRSDGTWDGTSGDFKCVSITRSRGPVTPSYQPRITCSPLKPPVGGSVTGYCSPGMPGFSCIVFCPSGYSGFERVRCYPNGKWSSSRISCKSKFCFINRNSSTAEFIFSPPVLLPNNQ